MFSSECFHIITPSLFFCLIACVLAFRCYVGETKNHEKPNNTELCVSAKYCLKKTRKSGNDAVHIYGCDEWSECRKSILDIFGLKILEKGIFGTEMTEMAEMSYTASSETMKNEEKILTITSMC
ncbi:unnamed protein product [Cylicocyclus nassatus]|uniref:Uncharacterized protein n=1 Tax=Cylicocyclus nassatus TaxID=53992 RepID=A0AA36GTS2_CYLNA|nr:unnamed protein product [Cylicocyclus nassatus]